MRAPLVVLLLALPALAGCFGEEDTRAFLVPYPQLGAAATYDVEGAFVDLARWENAHPFAAGRAAVLYEVSAGGVALDAGRALHDAFRVNVLVDEGGGNVPHASRFVSFAHQGVVQAYYKLSQDQGVLSFDERGYPWLWGASALFGEELREGAAYPVVLMDNLGVGREVRLAWRVEAREGDAFRLALEGSDSIEARLWMTPASPWPQRVEMTLKDDGLAPFVRADAALPARMDATLRWAGTGLEPLAPRNRDAGWVEDAGVVRLAWDGEKPPDGAAGYVPYLLQDAVRDAKLLDQGLQAWLREAEEPRLYRGTFKMVQVGVGPANVSGQTAPYWLLQFMEKGGAYYEVEVERVSPPLPLETGVPRVTRSGPAEPPKDPNHGWFPRDAPAQDLVTLSEGVRVVREVFGATDVEIFLRSFASPPGYSYYIDGGFQPGGEGRYTVVYNPATGRIEGATGPVTPRVS